MSTASKNLLMRMDDEEFFAQKKHGLENCDKPLVYPPDNHFASSATISADPRICPTLFFQDDKYFSMVSLLGRKPTVVMPIRQKDVLYGDIREKYSKSIPKNPSDFHTTFCYVVTSLLDYELEKMNKRRAATREKKKNNGKIPHAYDMMAVEVVMDGE